ncbi:hypothetical protein E2C01_074126 [Portunus trituberculatus]|uniref:Uncharacterized protein n=1 Tax=Portunus trituberculatus TaxID=210409 RepID=A0A5B7I2K5_PORTR|nr:hypothetical protein [Portunus trituberculatus]
MVQTTAAADHRSCGTLLVHSTFCLTAMFRGLGLLLYITHHSSCRYNHSGHALSCPAIDTAAEPTDGVFHSRLDTQ